MIINFVLLISVGEAENVLWKNGANLTVVIFGYVLLFMLFINCLSIPRRIYFLFMHTDVNIFYLYKYIERIIHKIAKNG